MLTTLLLLVALQDASAPPRDPPPQPCPAGLSGLACAADNPQIHIGPGCHPVSVDGELLYPAYATSMPHTEIDIYPDPLKPGPPVYTGYSNAWRDFHALLGAGGYYVVINAEGMDMVRQKLFVPCEPGIHLDVLLHPATKPSAITEDAVGIEDLARKTPAKVSQAFEKSMDRESKTSPQEMFSTLQEVLNTTPDYYEANLELGLEYKKAGQREDAIRALTHALQVNSGSMLARAALGEYAFEAGDFQTSANLLSEAARLGSKSPDVYYMLGTSYYKLGQLGMADGSLTRALDIAPSIGKAYLQLYNVYMKGQMPDKALAALETYLEKYPNTGDRDYVQSMADKLRKSMKPNPQFKD